MQTGLAQGVHGDGEAVRWREMRGQRRLQLSLGEELLPVLQVGRVHLQEGRAAGVARLQHGGLSLQRTGHRRVTPRNIRKINYREELSLTRFKLKI